MAKPITCADTATVLALCITRRFTAPREAVFRAWTRPEELAQWFGPKDTTARNVRTDPQPGGRYSLEMHEIDGIHRLSGIYREVEPPKRLVFTWAWDHGEIAGVEMLVAIDFVETEDGGTLLTLTHERLPSQNARDLHEKGWIGTLDCLEDYIAPQDQPTTPE